MMSAIIKKARQAEQQNQATVTTKIYYIQKIMTIKKLINKSKKLQIKQKLIKKLVLQ